MHYHLLATVVIKICKILTVRTQALNRSEYTQWNNCIQGFCKGTVQEIDNVFMKLVTRTGPTCILTIQVEEQPCLNPYYNVFK